MTIAGRRQLVVDRPAPRRCPSRPSSRAASRSVCDGPTRQRDLGHPIPHLHLRPPPRRVREIVRIASSVPDRRRPGKHALPGASTYRLRRASRRMHEPLANPSARCSPSPPWPRVVVAASGCGTTTADIDRGRILFIQKCGVCHTLAQAGTTAPDRAQPRRRLRRRARSRRGRRHDRRDRQGPGRVPAPEQRQPRGLDARRHRHRPGPRRRRRLRRQVRRRARRGAAEGRPAAPAPRSSPTTAAAAATRSPPPNRAASPARTSTKSCPARARR